MAIAKELPEVNPIFMQPCPFCERQNRCVVHGVYIKDNKMLQHPDMGYSFCNCKSIFYTRSENLREPFSYEPVEGIISAPDPFFAWPDPYEFKHWDVRRYEIIWPIDSLCEILEEQGYKIISAERDFDLHSKTPQYYHIKVSRE